MKMVIYPAIDIKDGKCVRLTQGRFDSVTVYGDEPSEMAKKWLSLGAEYLHVVDLDGALDGKWTNGEQIKKICEASNVPVQTGGGIRTLEDIKMRLNSGVNRVIIGTVAVKNPSFVKEAIETFGKDRIVVGIDAKGGYVATHGWEKVSSETAVDFARKMCDMGVCNIVYTDIATDGMLTGCNVLAMSEMAKSVSANIIASGGIGSNEDILALRGSGVGGVIVGRALYTNRVDLKKAIEDLK